MGKGSNEDACKNTPSDQDGCAVIIVHGGAGGSIPGILAPVKETGVQIAAKAGYSFLLKGGSAVDAVEAAVRSLEDHTLFNAGHGSTLTNEETVEMDALIMDGSTLDTGAVTCVSGIPNPVSLARRVMTDTDHCLLSADGAFKFARQINMKTVEPRSLASDYSRYKYSLLGEDVDYKQALQLTINSEEDTGLKLDGQVIETMANIVGSHDTVGAVAMDQHGNIACANSTGGLARKMPGRVSDSSLCGCGGYANKLGGAAATGHGESIMKVTLARDVVFALENGKDVIEACQNSIKKMTHGTKGKGGVISIDKDGNYGKAFSTCTMPWAAIKGDVMEYGISPDQDKKIIFNSD